MTTHDALITILAVKKADLESLLTSKGRFHDLEVLSIGAHLIAFISPELKPYFEGGVQPRLPRFLLLLEPGQPLFYSNGP